MQRMVLSYGILSGLIVIVTTIIGISLAGGDSSFEFSVWLGYLIMLVALSMIFIAIKRFRDHEQGGVITFAKGVQVGLGIAVVAGVMYVAVWEIYLAATDYSFISGYTQSIIESRRASGASDAEMAELIVEMDTMKANYSKPWFRLPMTFLEIFPVGLLITLLSAAVLRNSQVAPART
jgi:hypothetical protein